MTYRDALQQVAQGADPASVLAEHGLEDVSPEAFSSALLHFADTAPIETADLFAPINARLSPVPFEDGDLPDFNGADAILAGGGDVFDLLDQVGLADPGGLPTASTDLDRVAELLDENGLSADGDADAQQLIDALEGPDSDDGYDGDASAADDAVERALERVDRATDGHDDFGRGGAGDDRSDGYGADESSEVTIDALEAIGRSADGLDLPTDIDESFDSLDTADLSELFDQVTEAADIDDLDGTDPADLGFE